MTDFVYNVRNVCTVRELIETSAEEFGTKTAFVIKNKDGSLTHKPYSLVLDEVKYLATYLCSKGLELKHIAIVGKNSYDWALSYLAVCCGVGICVPVDKELKAPETKNILEMSDSDALIYSPEQKEKIDECDFDMCLFGWEYMNWHDFKFIGFVDDFKPIFSVIFKREMITDIKENIVEESINRYGTATSLCEILYSYRGERG